MDTIINVIQWIHTYFKLIIPGLQPNVDVGAESQLETERLGEESAVRGGRHERTKWPR